MSTLICPFCRSREWVSRWRLILSLPLMIWKVFWDLFLNDVHLEPCPKCRRKWPGLEPGR